MKVVEVFIEVKVAEIEVSEEVASALMNTEQI